jgi:hypothetical protein
MFSDFHLVNLITQKKSGRKPRVSTNVFQNIKHTERGFNFFKAIYNSTKENNEICNLPIYYLYKKKMIKKITKLELEKYPAINNF